MLRVNGFFGHVAKNHLRSMWMLLGFIVAFQLVIGAVLTPIIMFYDPLKMVFISPLAYFQKYGIAVFVLSSILFLIRYFLHLKDLKSTMGFKSVSNDENPRLHKLVAPLAIAAGIQMPEIAILEDDALNAFACGYSENSAIVVVTRGLLKNLDDDELGAVIAHEITHIANADIQLLAVANVSISSITMLAKFNIFQMKGKRSILGIVLPFFAILSYAVGFVLTLGKNVAKVTRLVIASSREYIADAEAVRLTHNPAALVSALRKIEGKSEVYGLDNLADAMMIDGATVGEFATHPTIQERIAVLRQHAGAMAHSIDAPVRFASASVSRFSSGYVAELKNNAQTDQTKGAPAPKNLIDRIRVNEETNLFGVSKGAQKGMRITVLVIIGFAIISHISVRTKMNEVSKQLGGVSTSVSEKSKKRPAVETTKSKSKQAQNTAPISEQKTSSIKLEKPSLEGTDWELR